MGNQVESYQKVIDILASETFAERAVVLLIEIAKQHPQIVVDADMCLKSKDQHLHIKYGVSETVIDCLLGGQKLAAIKEYRICTGAGLKESKDAVEAIIDKDPKINKAFYRNYRTIY